MENRRSFIKKCVLGYAAFTTGGLTSCSNNKRANTPMKDTAPKKVLVIWYSQTGHTERIGRVIGHEWQEAGLEVKMAEYRNLDKTSLSHYDLITIGSPVYYMDVPVNFKQWLTDIPRIDGVPAAAFVTFGGSGDGQHNTACGLLDLMTDKGGIPVGMETFGNMSTFAPTWSIGNEKRILSYKDLPNDATYSQARRFSADVLKNINSGLSIDVEESFGMDSLMKIFPQIWFTKLMISSHMIDEETCIECGICADKCPVEAIDLEGQDIDESRCIACLGCINNCPVNAVKMNFLGKSVYGFNEFLQRNQIKIADPAV